MADISSWNIHGTSYNLADAAAREDITELKSAVSVKASASGIDFKVCDAATEAVAGLKVYGHTEQILTPGWQLVPFSDGTNWYMDPENVGTYTHDDSTNSITFNCTTAAAKFDVGERRFQKDVSSIVGTNAVDLTIDFDVVTDSTASFTVTAWAIGCATTNGTTWSWSKSKAFTGVGHKSTTVSITAEQAANTKTVMFLLRVAGFNVNDVFTISNYRIGLASVSSKYTIKNAASPVVHIGDTSMTIPYTLRSVENANGQVVYGLQDHLADVVDFGAGTMTQYIDPSIDNATSEEIDPEDYILSQPVTANLSAELINAYKLLSTKSPETAIYSESVESPMIILDYAVDLEAYLDLISSVSGVITPEQFGAVGDGITDDTDAVSLAMNRSGVIQFGKGKVYKCGLLSLPNLHNAVILGNGSKLLLDADSIDITENFQYFLSNNSLNDQSKGTLEIHDLYIDCNGRAISVPVSMEYFPSDTIGGAKLLGFTSVVLDGVEISGTVTGNGLSFGCQKLYAQNCHLHDLGFYENVTQITFATGYSFGGLSGKIADETDTNSEFVVKNCTFERVSAACLGAEKFSHRVIENNIFYETYSGVLEDSYQPTVDNASLSISYNTLIKCQTPYLINANIRSVDRISGNNYTISMIGNKLMDCRGAEHIYMRGQSGLFTIAYINNWDANNTIMDAHVIFEDNVIVCTESNPTQIGADDEGRTDASFHMLITFANIRHVDFRNNTLINRKGTSRILLSNAVSGATIYETIIEGNHTVGKWKYELGGNLSPFIISGNTDELVASVPDDDGFSEVTDYASYHAVFDNIYGASNVMLRGNSTTSAKALAYIREAYASGKWLVLLDNEAAATLLLSSSGKTHAGTAYIVNNVAATAYNLDGSTFADLHESGTMN